MQRNARVESESILVLLCIAMSVNVKVMQHNARPCIMIILL